MQVSESRARMTPDDIAVLKAMFEDRENSVDAIRKIFLPTLTADNPIFTNQDMWTGSTLALDGMTPEQKVIAVESHIKLVKHIEGCFGVIKALIGQKNESPEQVLARLQKDSTK